MHTVSGNASYSYQKSVLVTVEGSKDERVRGSRSISSLDEIKNVKNNVETTIGNSKLEEIGGDCKVTVGKN